MVDTPAVEEPFSPASRHVESRRQEDLVRPPAPARAAVHDRDVGAVRLLRHAGAADALSDQAFPVLRPPGDRPLRRLHRAGLSDAAGRRLPRRPVSRLQALGEVRRDHDGDRLFHAVLRRSPAKPYATIDGQRYEVVVEHCVDRRRATERSAYIVDNGQKLEIRGNDDGSVSLLGQRPGSQATIAKGAFESAPSAARCTSRSC